MYWLRPSMLCFFTDSTQDGASAQQAAMCASVKDINFAAGWGETTVAQGELLNNTPCKPGDQIGFLLTFGDNEQLSTVLGTPTHGSLAIFKNGKRFGGGALYPGGSVDRAVTLAVQLGCPGASVRLIPKPTMPWMRQQAQAR